MKDRKYIASLINHSNETLILLSNKEKKKRERMVVAAFLRCLGISFLSSEITYLKKDPPDIIFQNANFEVTELIDSERRRGNEYKERHKALLEATSIEETLLLYKSSISISYNEILEVVKKALLKKARHYTIPGCFNLDALVYVNLQNRFLAHDLSINDNKNINIIVSQGWRSASFVMPPYSHVIFANESSPVFLQENAGKIKQACSDPDTFFKLQDD